MRRLRFGAAIDVMVWGGMLLLTTVASVAPVQAQQTKAPAAKRTEIVVETIARGLEHPWAMQFLPDGRFVVTERPGRLRIGTRDGKLSAPVAGVPDIDANGQGGLLDVMLPADFQSTGEVYLAYAEARERGRNGTTVARARLELTADGGRLVGVAPIFRQQPSHRGGLHFGARIVQARDGHLMIAVGERFQMEGAQDLGRHWGKVVRIAPDGQVPKDNPFIDKAGALPEVFSFGHRNPQAAAIHPDSGRLWVVEHGPRGGDEVNVVLPGRNYGWPVIGYGIDYSGQRLHASTAKAGMEQPVYYWVPSIAPSGMAFYTGSLFPDWRGNLLVGALAGRALHRLLLDGERIVGEEVLLAGARDRIRDVRQGPDGAIWLLTDDPDGKVLRIVPAR